MTRASHEISAAEGPEPTALRAGFVATPGDPAQFWRDVVAGDMVLTPHEDATVWSARALGYSFEEIAFSILLRRVRVADNLARGRRRRAHNHARRWREDYRREKTEHV